MTVMNSYNNANITTIKHAKWLRWPQTEAIINAFSAANVTMRFVGGAVRNSIMGRDTQDIDIATTASPQKVMAILRQANIKAIPTGLSHGTVTAILDGKQFEITTLRRDIKTYGRHAEVLFTNNWQEDAKRRDFTMNAIYCDKDGNLYDYYNGIYDAQHNIVKFIGNANQRITEDGLRILRFFRFNAYYGNDHLDAEGLNACHQQRHIISELSGERIQQEMLKLLAADRTAFMLDVMQKIEISPLIFGKNIEYDNLAIWPKIRLIADVEPNPITALAILLRANNNSHELLEYISHNWRLANKLTKLLATLISQTSITTDLTEKEQKSLLRQLGATTFEMMILISWTERLAEYPDKSQLIAAAYRSMLGLVHRWTPPIFPLSGNDLQQIGIPPGKQMGHYLQMLEQWWEQENYQPNKDELLHYIKSQL